MPLLRLEFVFALNAHERYEIEKANFVGHDATWFFNGEHYADADLNHAYAVARERNNQFTVHFDAKEDVETRRI